MFGLENNTILINLAVSLLIALVTLLYFRQQMTTIDHKVNSMFSLLTSMTQELNNLSRLNLLQNTDTDVNEISEDENINSNIMNQQFDSRINVSDDDDNNVSSSDESGSDESGSDESGSDESGSDDSGSDTDVSTTPLNDLTSLNMGSELHNIRDDDIKVIEMDQDSEIDKYSETEYELEDVTNEEITNEESSDDNEQLEFQNLVEDLIEQTIELTNIEKHDELNTIEVLMDEDIDITTLENESKNVKSINVPIDYSKMSVKALKDIVSTKKLATNVNKMKKQELISLLSV